MATGRRTLSALADLRRPPVLVVMGVSGSGKSTVAGLLADRLGWPLVDGDALHAPENVAKMAAGHPLTDADRQPWLHRVAGWIKERVAAGEAGIIACSSLRRSYRDVIRDPHVVFVYLRGSREQIAVRLAKRRGHFMPAVLLDSQFAALEPPGADEQSLTVDVDRTPDEQVDIVLAALDQGAAAGG